MSATGLRLQAQAGGAGPIRVTEGHRQWRLSWRRLRRDKTAMASAAVIVIMAALALAAPAFAALRAVRGSLQRSVRSTAPVARPKAVREKPARYRKKK